MAPTQTGLRGVINTLKEEQQQELSDRASDDESKTATGTRGLGVSASKPQGRGQGSAEKKEQLSVVQMPVFNYMPSVQGLTNMILRAVKELNEPKPNPA